MPVILETISWILKNVNVGVDRLIVGYGVRFVYSEGTKVMYLLLCTETTLFKHPVVHPKSSCNVHLLRSLCIGLTDVPKSGGAMTPPAPPRMTPLSNCNACWIC